MSGVGTGCARTVGVWQAGVGIAGLLAAVADRPAERAFRDTQGDVHHIVIRSTAIRKARQVAAQTMTAARDRIGLLKAQP